MRMFIKKTRILCRETGKYYFNFQLVESIRTERGPRQRILLNLGANLDLDPQECKVLANRIETIATGQQDLFVPSNKIEKLAQSYASRLIKNLSEPVEKTSPGSAVPEVQNFDASQIIRRVPEISEILEITKNETLQEEHVSINIHSIETSEPRTVGTEHLLLQMAHQLELPKQLQELGLSQTDVCIALGSIIARATFPCSERATYKWLRTHSGVGELLNFDFQKIPLGKLYRVSDKLLKHKTALENRLEAIESKFHGYASTIALYDLTNTYMEGQNQSNPKARHGLSKEKRSDCPLVTLGLVMNEHGFLNRTSILPGNASEPKTLEEMISNLSVHHSLFKPTIILDAGIATEDNLTWLRDKGYTYIVSARQDAPSIELEKELVPVDDLQGFVKAALIKNPDNNSEERWLYCESEAKAAVAEGMKQSFRTRFEDDLKKLAAGLIKPKGRKKFTKVLERVGRLKEKHKRISGCYEVNVVGSEDRTIATAIEWKIIDEKMSEKLTGSYFLRTNLIGMGAKELWQLYNILRKVEDAFRFMKSSLGLRPVYHQKERRVDGHLWITIMAYHLIQNCLYQLNSKGITYHWQTIRKIMLSRVRVTVRAKTKEGKTLYHRSSTQAEGEQKEIYKALGISTQILKSQKTIL
jgi:transposase